MASGEIKKQVSLYFPVSVFREMRFEAARLRIPMTELCRRWMADGLNELCGRSAEKETEQATSTTASAPAA